MKTPRMLLAASVAGLAGVTLLTSCSQPVQILSVDVQNPTPRVGEQTTIRVEALAGWFRNPQFYWRAQRGRIVGPHGETGRLGDYVLASNQVRYYAPYTSTFQSGNGVSQNDVIEILAQDGSNISKTTRPVTVTGSTVVFSTQDSNSGQNGTLMVATDTGGGQVTPPISLKDLSGKDLKGVSPSISPKGDRIAYVFYPGDGTSKIMMRDASGQVLSLTSDAQGLSVDPAWSPDGAFLVYASNKDSAGQTFDIYMMNVDQNLGGRAVTRLTNDTWDNRHPAWNPVPSAPVDQMLAVVARKNSLDGPGSRAQNWNVFLMDNNGHYTRQVSQVAGDGDNWACEPAWSPNGAAIAYTRYGPINNYQSSASKFQRIFVQELQTSATVMPLNLSNTDANARERSPVWSTDRPNQLYFLSSAGSAAAGGRVFETTYQAGSNFPAQPVFSFQALYLPLTRVDGTNRDIFGFHPLDWR